MTQLLDLHGSTDRMNGMARILNDIRKAIRRSERSRYWIWQRSGVSQAQLSRLMHREGGLSLDATEKLLDCLGQELTIQPKPQRKGRK